MVIGDCGLVPSYDLDGTGDDPWLGCRGRHGWAGVLGKPRLRWAELPCASRCGRVDILCRVEGLGRVARLDGSSDLAWRTPVCRAMRAPLFLK